MSYRRLRRTIDQANKQYGDNFGTKLWLYTLAGSMIFVFIIFGIELLGMHIDNKEQFILDSNRKYIVTMETSKGTTYYFEVDFLEGEVTKRSDGDKFKRQHLEDVKTNLDELENFLLQITNNESNQVFTEEDKTNLYKQNCYIFYKITTHEQKEYYIKDVSQVEYLDGILDEKY